MSRLARVFLSCLCFQAASVANAHEAESRSVYQSTLQSALKLIERKEKPDQIVKDMNTLVKESKTLLASFAKSVPECQDYISKALAVADQMPAMSLDKIERDYHADAALPKASGICHHAKDLLVHPATVLILLKQDKPDFTKMQAELIELSTHLTVVNQKVLKK